MILATLKLFTLSLKPSCFVLRPHSKSPLPLLIRSPFWAHEVLLMDDICDEAQAKSECKEDSDDGGNGEDSDENVHVGFPFVGEG